MTLEQVERKYYETLIELSMGDLAKKSELCKYWLDLENYPEYQGVALLKTGEILSKILNRHPDWGEIKKSKKRSKSC